MYLYEFFQILIYRVLLIARVFSKNSKFIRFVDTRSWNHLKREVESAKQKAKDKNIQRIFLIHAASAGELEQVKPIADRLSKKAQIGFFITYFSPSAEKFLKDFPGAIGSCSFPLDTQKRHNYILKSLNIEQACIVRYDIWPGFIQACCRMQIPLNLFAASKEGARLGVAAQLGLWWKKLNYRKFTRIFAVTPQDVTFYKSLCPSANVIYAGDAKWRRAQERAQLLHRRVEKTSTIQFVEQKKNKGRPCFVFGSPHKEEHEVALRLCAENSSAFIVYVPHEVNTSNIEKLTHEISISSKIVLFSELEQGAEFEQDAQVLLVDSIGHLAELYGQADVAIIGGGFDGQIHNTLEAAAHPVATVFGNRFKRAREARELIDANAARSFNTPEELFQFLSQCANLEKSGSSDIETSLSSLRQNALSVFELMPDTSEIIFEALR